MLKLQAARTILVAWHNGPDIALRQQRRQFSTKERRACSSTTARAVLLGLPPVEPITFLALWHCAVAEQLQSRVRQGLDSGVSGTAGLSSRWASRHSGVSDNAGGIAGSTCQQLCADGCHH